MKRRKRYLDLYLLIPSGLVSQGVQVLVNNMMIAFPDLGVSSGMLAGLYVICLLGCTYVFVCASVLYASECMLSCVCARVCVTEKFRIRLHHRHHSDYCAPRGVHGDNTNQLFKLFFSSFEGSTCLHTNKRLLCSLFTFFFLGPFALPGA